MILARSQRLYQFAVVSPMIVFFFFIELSEMISKERAAI